MNQEQFNMRIAHRNKDKYKQYATNIQGYEVDASSINKVPCVQITQDNSVNNLIRTLHQKILFEALIRSDGHKFDEVGCLLELIQPYENTPMIMGCYDKTRGISGICVSNNKEYIDFLASHSEKQLLFMHNHPNNSQLSYGDIWNLIMTDEIYAVTAVGNSGGIYIAYKSATFNKVDLKHRMRTFGASLNGLSEFDKDQKKRQLLSRLQSEQNKYGIIFKYSRSRR